MMRKCRGTVKSSLGAVDDTEDEGLGYVALVPAGEAGRILKGRYVGTVAGF